jgi:ficolin
MTCLKVFVLVLVGLSAVSVGQRTTDGEQQCQQPCAFMITSMAAQLRQVEQRIKEVQDKPADTGLEDTVQQLTRQYEEVQQKYEDLNRANEDTKQENGDIQQKLDDALQELSQTKEQNADILRRLDRLDAFVQNSNPQRSCLEILTGGQSQSGVYTIQTNRAIGSYPIKVNVYCDMETAGGGWLVFQRRKDGSENFTRTWEEYAAGFGNLDGEFWLGNTNLNLLTTNMKMELRVDMRALDGSTAYAQYSNFHVGTEAEDFVLTVSGYSGTAGDSLASGPTWSIHNGMRFSTVDRDNDLQSSDNCANSYRGGYWYNGCHKSNPNGAYLNGPYSGVNAIGVVWFSWQGYYYSLPFIELKIRPIQ